MTSSTVNSELQELLFFGLPGGADSHRLEELP